jgi:hypothetical protein
MVIGRIHNINRITLLASEGQGQGPESDAGKVLIVWYEARGRVVRLYHETVNNASHITAVDNAIFDDPCWRVRTTAEERRWARRMGYGDRHTVYQPAQVIFWLWLALSRM